MRWNFITKILIFSYKAFINLFIAHALALVVQHYILQITLTWSVFYLITSFFAILIHFLSNLKLISFVSFFKNFFFQITSIFRTFLNLFNYNNYKNFRTLFVFSIFSFLNLLKFFLITAHTLLLITIIIVNREYYFNCLIFLLSTYLFIKFVIFFLKNFYYVFKEIVITLFLVIRFLVKWFFRIIIYLISTLLIILITLFICIFDIVLFIFLAIHVTPIILCFFIILALNDIFALTWYFISEVLFHYFELSVYYLIDWKNTSKMLKLLINDYNKKYSDWLDNFIEKKLKPVADTLILLQYLYLVDFFFYHGAFFAGLLFFLHFFFLMSIHYSWDSIIEWAKSTGLYKFHCPLSFTNKLLVGFSIIFIFFRNLKEGGQALLQSNFFISLLFIVFYAYPCLYTIYYIIEFHYLDILNILISLLNILINLIVYPEMEFAFLLEEFDIFVKPFSNFLYMLLLKFF